MRQKLIRQNQSNSFKRDRIKGVLLIALSAIGFGAMPIFTRYAYAAGADLYGVLIVRFLVAGLALLAVAHLRKLTWPPLPSIARLAALGGIGYVGMSYCYFAALNHVPASLAALLLYAYPTIVMVLAALFLREKITAIKLGALLLCSLGTALTIGPSINGSSDGISAFGIGLALVAAAIYASYITFSTKITHRIDPIVTTLVVCLAAGAVFTLLALVRTSMGAPPQFPQTATGWAGVAGGDDRLHRDCSDRFFCRIKATRCIAFLHAFDAGAGCDNRLSGMAAVGVANRMAVARRRIDAGRRRLAGRSRQRYRSSIASSSDTHRHGLIISVSDLKAKCEHGKQYQQSARLVPEWDNHPAIRMHQ